MIGKQMEILESIGLITFLLMEKFVTMYQKKYWRNFENDDEKIIKEWKTFQQLNEANYGESTN